jgi:hypothetical protein
VLREISGVRQDSVEVRRRWFQDDYLDLFVWTDRAGELVAFQLAYDRLRDEHLIEWDHARGYLHRRVDDSPGGVLGIRPAAILTLGKRFPKYRVMTAFDARSDALPASIRAAVRARLAGFNNVRPRPRNRFRFPPHRAHRL